MTKTISKDEALTEAQFQESVIQIATEIYGWEVFHDGDSRRSNAGFPDLVLVKDGRLIFAELKREKESYPSKDQRKWLAKLRDVGNSTDNVLVVLWRPSSNWQEVLSGRAWGYVHRWRVGPSPGLCGGGRADQRGDLPEVRLPAAPVEQPSTEGQAADIGEGTEDGR